MLGAKDIARVLEYIGIHYEGEPIGKTRLLKLLYLAQGHAFGELGHGLFRNSIDAWDFGPVVAVVYEGYDKVVEKTERDGITGIQLTPEEMDLILDVWNQYHGYNATELVEKTHEPGAPWRDTYKYGVKNLTIPDDLIAEFFKRPENRLPRSVPKADQLPVIESLPAEEYDPEEDAVWEALLNEA